MKRHSIVGFAFASLLLVAGCGLLNPNPPPPTDLPAPPVFVQTEVAETLTAVAPTAQGGTPIPPPSQAAPTQVAVATATAVPLQPTLVPVLPTATPGGETNPPVIQMVAPTDGVQITVGQGINVVALVSDDAGIRLVEFYADNVLFNSQQPPNPTTYQAVFPWTTGQSGPHTLFVVAYDVNNNASAPAAVTVNVVANTTAPVVSILAPSLPQNLRLGAQINVQVVANDDAGVTQIQMLVDNQPYNQVNSQNPNGQNPFAATFVYAANMGGTHTILMRAFDSAGNVGSSNPLTLNVNDTNPPAVAVNYSRRNVRVNEQVIVFTNATDASGIQRVELWVDGGLYNVYNSPNPAAQTSLAVQQIWTSDVPGNHTLFVRVFDVNNQSTASAATDILVRTPEQPTWTPTPYIPPPTRLPTRTPPPYNPPPNCQVASPNTNFRVELPNPVTIQWNCFAQAGITQIQVFDQYSGVMSVLIDQQEGNGQPQQGGEFEWQPQTSGVLAVYVVAYDAAGQRGESPHIPGVIEAQRPPTIVPPPFEPTIVPPPFEPTREPERPTLAGRWRGAIDNGAFIIDLQPRIGCSETQCAYGGRFDDTRDNVSGELNGQFDGSTLALSVEGAQPGDVTWNFEGQVTNGESEIVGQWSEARADAPSLQRGMVTFIRE